MRKRRALTTIKAISFILIFCLVFSYVSSVLVNPEPDSDLRHYQYVTGFFEEAPDSLDAIFIGASNVYSSWIASVGYKQYGLAVRDLPSAGLGGDCIKEIIQNIHDAYPNALYIVALNSFLWETGHFEKHYFLDYWPILKKPELISDLYVEDVITADTVIEFLVPIVRFHSRWDALEKADFHHNFNQLKGESIYQVFLGTAIDVSASFSNTDKREELDISAAENLNEFLSYCEKENIKILFVGLPWVASEHEKAMMNYAVEVLLNSGYAVINLLDSLDELELNPKTDYYNYYHNNIHGALKITDYLSRYLLEHYDFPKKSSGGGYESWDIAYEKYKEIISPYLTEEELAQLP